MITLISTPACQDNTVSPPVTSRWIATECPNNFRLSRQDFIVNSYSSQGGFVRLNITGFTGLVDDVISVYDFVTDSVIIGKVTNVSGSDIDTDITYSGAYTFTYMNDSTLYGGFYFEGRLTINGIIESLTVIAYPDSKGYADLDISPILRTKTALGKISDYTATLMKETTKSGSFIFDYRGAWYGSSEPWTPEGGSISPPSDPIEWNYAECVRSEEQGSNLNEFVPSAINDAPFLNEFDEPVYFLGLPFDISFILPELTEVSPASDITITMKVYNSSNVQLGTDIVTIVPADSLEGFVNSLNIDHALIPLTASYFTVEISIP